MNVEKFMENIIEQIKEVQLKLGFVQEVIRLYFPAESLSRLLQIPYRSAKELLNALQQEQGFHNTVLGEIQFSLCRDERIEVCIPPAGAAYVHEFVPDPPFLLCMIRLFQGRITALQLRRSVPALRSLAANTSVKRWSREQILTMCCIFRIKSQTHGITASK